jgi:hypothetical protein
MPRGRKRAVDEAPNGADATNVAQKLKSKRTNSSTKQTYKSKINVMMDWLVVNFPESVDVEQNVIQIPLQKEVVLNFFGHICSRASLRDEQETPLPDDSPPLSASCVKGYRSALVDLYRSAEIELDPALNTELKVLLDGYDKIVNDLKRRGLMKINEGKRHLKCSGYSMLTVKLMRQTPEVGAQSWSTVTFSWAYFVLMWNLMSRSDSVDSIMLQHLDWDEDALIIEEQGHKGDQTGADKYGKHIYANPYEPAKCPILAVAVLLFTYSNRPEHGRQQLFSGTDSKDRFGKLLRRLLDGLSDDELRILGCPSEDIGAHSLRKGSSTYALGQVNGPNPVSVFLRMGQSLGKLKDRYIHYGEGADQLCGRMICGLPFDGESFGVLPPHFPIEICAIMDESFWAEIVPGFVNYPRGVQSAFPFFLASVIHHEIFLRANLNENHPIFRARIFTHNRHLDQLRGATILSVGMSPNTGLKATGIPPHLAIANQLNRLCIEVDKFQIEMKQYKENFASELPPIIASKVVDEIRQNFVVDGVAPLSIRDIDSRIAGLRSDIVQELQRVFHESTPSPGIQRQHVEESSTWKTWDWKDGLICHFVPPDWDFPVRTTVKTMWSLWHFGEKNVGIRPYRLLSKKNDVKKSQHMCYTRAKAVVSYIDQLVTEFKLLPNGNLNLDAPISSYDSVFEKAYELAITKLYASKNVRRSEEISYGRIYNVLCQYQKA